MFVIGAPINLRKIAFAYVYMYVFINRRIYHTSLYAWTYAYVCVYVYIHRCKHNASLKSKVSRLNWCPTTRPLPTNVGWCAMTHKSVWHDTYICVTWLTCVTWLIHLRDVTHSNPAAFDRHGPVWHDSFICVTWLILSAWKDSLSLYIYIYVYICDSFKPGRIRSLWARVTWLLQLCDMTHFVWVKGLSLSIYIYMYIYVYVSFHLGDMTHFIWVT